MSSGWWILVQLLYHSELELFLCLLELALKDKKQLLQLESWHQLERSPTTISTLGDACPY